MSMEHATAEKETSERTQTPEPAAPESASAGAGHQLVSRSPRNHRTEASLGFFAQRSTRAQHALAMRQIQQTRGNRFAQRVVAQLRNSAQRTCQCGGTCDSCKAQAAAPLPTATQVVQTQSHGTPEATGVTAADLRPAASPGEPLDTGTRRSMESHFGADFGGVRVHSGEPAARAADSIQADAYTIGRDVYFGEGKYDPSSTSGRRLLAHELTHVQQQEAGQAPTSVAASSTGEVVVGAAHDPLEREAEQAGDAVASGQSVSVQGATGSSSPQRSGILEWAENTMWEQLEKYVPDLVPILRRGPEGVLDWVKERVTSAFEAMFNSLMAPVRAVAGVGLWLQGHFAPLLVWMQDAAAKIAKNDCSPIREAAEKIEKVAESIITPIVEKVQGVAKKVGDFFKGLWDKIGAPVWDWIKQYAGQQWDLMQRLASWIWDKTLPIRNVLSRAWTWLKNKLGIGEGPEGQDGILQWVQRKAEAAWNWFLARIEPYKNQLMVVAGVLAGMALLFSPAGPVLIVGGIIVGVVQAVRWIKANWGGDMLVKARVYVEESLIPPLMGAVNRLTSAITKMAASINGKLGELAQGMGQMVSTVAASILRFAVAAVQWIANQVTDLVRWGTEKLHSLAEWIQTGLAKLHAYLQPMLEFFGKVAKTVADIYTLPFLLAGRVWNWIPACIRDPFVDFIIPIILRQISIFRELVRDTEAWQKTKAEVMEIIHLVFHNHDLLGALKAVFHLILRVFNVPVDLAIQVAKKAASAWDIVLAQPLAFIKNTVRAIGHGFKLLWKNLLGHLEYGIEGWLFGELADKGIHAPSSWTDPMAILGFILDVLGLSMNHIFELLAKRFDPAKVDRLRVWYARLSSAWQWAKQIIDTSKSPQEITAGLISQAKEFGKGLLESVIGWVAGAVATELAEIAAAAAASGGLSEVLDIARRIYRAIQSAVRWMRKILEMVNSVLDGILQIAQGAIEPAGAKLETAMHYAMPVVIGFLADQVGLGGIGEKMREFVDELREKVDEALLWMIDTAKAAIDAVIGAVTAGVEAIVDWWRMRRTFKVGSQGHTLRFEGEEANAQLVIESTPRVLEDWLSELKQGPLSATQKQAVADVEKEIKRIQDIKAETKGSFGKGKGEEIKQAFDEIVRLLSSVGLSAVPASVITFGKTTILGDTVGVKMTANPLSINPGGHVGSQPFEYSNLFKAVNQRGDTYVEGHLLNHHVHGPGAKENLIPITRSANTTMESQAESTVKKAVLSENKIVKYVVEAGFGQSTRRNIPAEAELPTQLVMNAVELEAQGDSWVPGPNVLLNNVPIENRLPPDTDAGLIRVEVNLSKASAADMQNIPGIGPTLAERIVSLRTSLGGRFRSYDQLSAADGIGEKTVERLREHDRWVKLF